MIQTSMDPAGVGSLEVQSSLPGRCGWGPRSLDISHAGLDGKSHLSMGDSIAFHCYDSRRGFFRVLETWNDQGRMILIIYIYILMLMFIYPARYFAVFLGTSWRHRVLRVSRKAKHTLKLTLFRA